MLNIRNVDVEFPFKPYDCQVAYMDRVIQCLQERKNGILESPTGTGKTLCLLCSTLSWRQTFVASMQLQQRLCSTAAEDSFKNTLENKLQDAAGTSDLGENSRGSFSEVPKIIYASRTHSQLGQVVQELKSTVYRPKVSIIGSREQLCIHSDVLKQETNSAKVHMCRAKVSARTCPFYNNLEAKKSERDFNSGILDIEDLVTLGQKHKVCPYYMARELKTGADIIFMPYNYLLDAKSRKAHNLDISGSIIVFDEAHNVEKVCEDTVSFDLTSFDIASCVEDVVLCMEFFANKSEGIEMEDEANVQDVDPEDVKTLKALFSKLEEEIDKIPLPKEGGQSFPSSFMFELMSKCGITTSTKDNVLELLEKLNPILASDTRGLRGKHFALSKFADALRTVFNYESAPTSSSDGKGTQGSVNAFKVYVKIEADSKKKQKSLDVWTSGSKTLKKGRTLSYWCFSPGHAMKNLMTHGVRTLILTSGTLSPMSSFTAELQIEFPIRLENPHVIEKHQVWVGVVTKAPNGATLNSSFEFRSTVEYMNGIGSAIANFARIVPNGLLVFFPSYPVMNKCLEHWQNTGIWSRISQHKPMFAEPRGKGDFVQAMEDFYAKINDPQFNGATFFAVCRGKVSEGLDFSDINGRAVVITGLPFPPKMDPQVNLKMNFLDGELRRKDKGAFKGLSGREWYRQQASRAVNQAIGRVIRHRQDYGAILLCDVRFTYPDALQQLPSWVRPHVKIFKEFGHVQRELIQFFKTADKLVDKTAMKNKQIVQEVKKDVESHVNDVTCQVSTSQQRAGNAIQFTHNYPQPLRRGVSKIREKQPSSILKHEDGATSLARLSVQYESNSKSRDTSRPRNSLVESLASSEAAQNSLLSKQDETDVIPSISDAIIGRRKVENQSKTKKVYKIVKSKPGNVIDDHETKKPTSHKTQKMQAAKEYIFKVRETLGDDNYKLFSKVLMQYKKTNDLQTLIEGLTPLFIVNQSMYGLFLDFSSYVRDCNDKLKFFKAYQDLTGHDVPASYMEGLRTKKRTETDFDQNCKVGKRQKIDENCKLTKEVAKETGISKGQFEDRGSSSKLNLLDNKTHLNMGR